MSDALKVGDRVRVRAGTRISKYPAGEKGTVIEGPLENGAGSSYYLVDLDRNQSRLLVALAAEEIEPDV